MSAANRPRCPFCKQYLRVKNGCCENCCYPIPQQEPVSKIEKLISIGILMFFIIVMLYSL